MAAHWSTDPGFELKRTYQRNMLLSMAILYGLVGVIAGGAKLFLGNSDPTKLISGNFESVSHGRGSLDREDSATRKNRGELVSVASGKLGKAWRLFVLGSQIKIVPDSSYQPPISRYRVSLAVDISEADMSGDLVGQKLIPNGGGGYGDGFDDALPDVPQPNLAPVPRFPDWELRRQINPKKTRPAKVYFGFLHWPLIAPERVVCTAFVSLKFFADGRLDYVIRRLAVDTGGAVFLPYFRSEVQSAMLRTEFDPATINGVKVSEEAELQAVFCPHCEAQAWSKSGDVEVYLKR